MTATATPAAVNGRLGNGQLRRQVAEWLAARPGPHTPGEIARDLGRSVGNALTTLADRGEADREVGRPVRYRANAAAAAAAIAPRAPAPPKPAPVAPRPAVSPVVPKSAAPGPVTCPSEQLYQPRALADMPDVEVLRRLRGERGARLAVRAAGHGQDQPGRSGLPRPDHGRWRRRHHDR